MTRRCRLGIHCPGRGTGGPWRYVHSLLQEIDLDAFDVRLFCDLPGEYEPRPAIRVVPLSAHRRAAPSASSASMMAPPARTSLIPRSIRLIAGFCQNARRLARRLRPHNLDLFHTQNTGCEEAPLAARLAGIPHILGTFHTDPTYDLQHERDGSDYQFLERLSNRSLTVGIAVSSATSRLWRQRTFLPSPRVVTIHNGIDAAKFRRRQSREAARRTLDLPLDAFVIAGVGRLEPAKGFADLIDAAALLRSDISKLVVAIAGEGPLRAALANHAERCGATVRFLGFQNDVQPLLDAADLFALPSLCETFGYALAEAMAAGLPVLGSAVGGVPEVIGAEAGIVLPPRQPALWAAAIRHLAADPARREQLGNAGRDRVIERFSERDMTRKTFELYRSVVRS